MSRRYVQLTVDHVGPVGRLIPSLPPLTRFKQETAAKMEAGETEAVGRSEAHGRSTSKWKMVGKSLMAGGKSTAPHQVALNFSAC